MAHYFFDVHGSGAAEWDDHGTECTDRPAIEQHVAELFLAHESDSDGDAFGQRLVSVTVHLSNGPIVLTATSKPGLPVRFNWATFA